MPCIIDAASRDPEIETLLHRIGIERQQPILTIVARAQERGELPAELDPTIVFGTIVGPIVFRKVVQRRPIDAGLRQRVPGRRDRRVAGQPCRDRDTR